MIVGCKSNAVLNHVRKIKISIKSLAGQYLTDKYEILTIFSECLEPSITSTLDV